MGANMPLKPADSAPQIQVELGMPKKDAQIDVLVRLFY